MCWRERASSPVPRRRSIGKALGAIVFADPVARRDLGSDRSSSDAGPVRRRRSSARCKPGADTARAVVLDAAILLEAGWDDLCDLVVFVDAPRAERMRRVPEQRGWSAADVRSSRTSPMAVRRETAPCRSGDHQRRRSRFTCGERSIDSTSCWREPVLPDGRDRPSWRWVPARATETCSSSERHGLVIPNDRSET